MREGALGITCRIGYLRRILRFILECARWAPSGENAQPWRFIVVRDKEGKEFLSKVY